MFNEEQAFQYIAENVTAPVFFQKLAAYGYAPQSEEAAQALWQLGLSLLSQDQTNRDDLLKTAAADIMAVAGSITPSQVSTDEMHKHYASETQKLAQSEELMKAAAVLAQAMKDG